MSGDIEKNMRAEIHKFQQRQADLNSALMKGHLTTGKKVVQIAGTWRESPRARRLLKEEAEAIFLKLRNDVSPGKFKKEAN